MKTKAWLSISLLTVAALIYCAPALTAPFWGDEDSWSNLLPIIHYRQSILEEHTLPLYTSLWYGGRAQWQNPLWSFMYLPATLIWLSLPLDWGARVVFLGHLIFSLIVGWKLSSLFLASEVDRISAAIILTSPMLAALYPGHLEMVMAWGWLLLAIFFLLNENFPPILRGAGSGTCWAIMALAGANYHVFYAGVLLLPIMLSFKKPSIILSFMAGASVGLIHLPSVWNLIGLSRSNATRSIPHYSTDFLGILTSLASGFAKPMSGESDLSTDVLGIVRSLASGLAKPMGWESWALIGIPVVYLFVRSIFTDIRVSLIAGKSTITSQKIALLLTIITSSLLATGILYSGHHLLDTFRVPVRALSVVASATTLFVFLSLRRVSMVTPNAEPKVHFQWLLVASAVQIIIISWLIRPSGSLHSPYDPEAQNLAILLQADDAKSVWFSPEELSSMYVHVALTEFGIALPNVYYGDMDQEVPVRGPYCGYSFDHLIIPVSDTEEQIELVNDISQRYVGRIPIKNLQLISRITLNAQPYDVYRVTC
jgi:hypothetical protein